MSGVSRPVLAISAFVKRRIAAVATATAVLAASYLYAPFAIGGPVLCPLHGLVGLPCPSCGLTRAFCALARLDPQAALGFNALGVPPFGLVAAVPFVSAYEAVRGRRSSLHTLLYARWTGWLSAATILTYHLGRLGVWLWDGTLVREYVRTSWTYALLQAVGAVGG